MAGRLVIIVLATIACQHIDAFTPGSFRRNDVVRPQATRRLATMGDNDDLSIPYDAAVRKAYDEWRAQYNKGAFDNARFNSFKANYEAITIANVMAKKAARESGSGTPRLLTLNEFGDYTSEEYESLQAGSAQSNAASSGEVLGKVVEAAQSQAGAASALMEAADALAEEEKKLARQLGLESIEELEAAVDALEGIDEEGLQETDNLAREARIRSAYLEWCKTNEKEPVESRFATFSSNFLAMEKFAESSGKEMVLNKYADCTKEEYLALVSAPSPDLSAPAASEALMKTALSGDFAGDEDVMAALKAVAEAEAAANAAVQVDNTERKALKEAADAKAEAAAQAKLEAAEKKKAEIAARKALAELSQEELRERSEKERKERQIAQEKAAEELSKANEAAAIAMVKEQEAREAAQIAKRKQFELEAAERARQQAREWEEKQERLRARSAPAPKPKPRPKVKSFFESFVPKSSPIEPEPKTKGLEIEIDLSSIFNVPESTKSGGRGPAPAPAFNLFATPKSQSKAAPKPVVKVASLATQKPLSAPRPSPSSKDVSFNFFGSLSPKTASKTATKSVPAPKISPTSSPKPAAKTSPGPPMFAFFGSPASTPTPSKAPSTPSPKPPPNPNPFTFLGSSPKPAPVSKGSTVTNAKPSPAAAPKAASQAFSFFGSPKSSPTPTPVPEPAPVKKQSFSFFGSSTSSSSTLTIKKSTSVAPAAKNVPLAQSRRSGTIALKKADPKKATGGISLFGGGSGKNDNIPVLSRFKQNKDGSLTGIVSNASGFKNGTKITTSPVRNGAKPGQIVTTASGSKYRLE